jgi:hypothetical protein
MALEGWFVEQIDKSLAQSIVVEHHYLHRAAPCSKAFGLFDQYSNLRGVVMYGTPSSSALRAGLAGKDEALNVIELTRLWIDDDSPRNAESFLIGRSVRQAGKELVVSFADIAANHLGIVYQATNWLYTGLSAKRTDWTVEGVDKHGHTWADKYSAAEMREMFGDRFTLKPRSRKHRYIFINAKGRRKTELLSKLLYPLEPYPKRLQETDRIDVGQERNTPDPLTDTTTIGRDKSTAEDRQ